MDNPGLCEDSLWEDSIRCHFPDGEASVKTMDIGQDFLEFSSPEPVVRVEGRESAGEVP